MPGTLILFILSAACLTQLGICLLVGLGSKKYWPAFLVVGALALTNVVLMAMQF